MSRPVKMLFDRVEEGEAVLRLEPAPDPLWRYVFEGTLAELAGRVRLEDDRLLLQVTPGMLHEGVERPVGACAQSARRGGERGVEAATRQRRD